MHRQMPNAHLTVPWFLVASNVLASKREDTAVLGDGDGRDAVAGSDGVANDGGRNEAEVEPVSPLPGEGGRWVLRR